ncbi:MAG: 4-hydroxybenzoate octaprenyltransferase [Mariprofundus sp.]|nr:4-hydroxybenzoate octaprenyltransferase [Mariprofundus sp.]
MQILERIQIYKRLMRADRPIGTMLLLWPTLWAVWIASAGQPSVKILLIFVCGVFLMRSAGCVINDYADRKIDPLVKRTEARPLATGAVSSREALGLFIALCLSAFALVLMTNGLTIMLSFIALLLAAIYPFMKRYTHWPQVFLGAAFSMAIPMAFAAARSELPTAAWLLFLANIFWVVAYDTMYAMVDRDDDLKIGVKSTAVLFGRYDRQFIGLFQALFLLCMVAVGSLFELGVFYYGSLGMALLIAMYHQRLIYQRQRSSCFKAFLHNNWLGGIIFIGLLLDLSF